MQSSLVKLLSAVSLLLVSLTVDCHVADKRIIRDESTEAELQHISSNAKRLSNPYTGYRQFTSLVFDESRPVLQELLPPPANKLSNTRDWRIYKGHNYENPYPEPDTAPILKLIDNTASEAFRRGDWVYSFNQRRSQPAIINTGWVRCLPKIATPNVTDIARDTQRVIHESNTQLWDAFKETFLAQKEYRDPTRTLTYIFKYRNVHCMFLDGGLSLVLYHPNPASIVREIESIFHALLLDIKLMHWYMPTRQVLRYSKFDVRRARTDGADVRRNAALPVFYKFPGSTNDARLHNWSIIKETAQRVVEVYDRLLHGVSSAKKNTIAPSVHLTAQLCRLITETSTDMTFNELVERIAELAKYPPDVIMKTTSLDAGLADLKMVANLDLLKAARLAKAMIYNDAASGFKVVSKNPNFPPEVTHMILPYVVGNSDLAINAVFFRAVRAGQTFTDADINRLEEMKEAREIKELLRLRGLCWRGWSPECNYTF